MKNIMEIKKLERTNYMNNNSPNIVKRISVSLLKEMDVINNIRKENKMKKLSYPKITELIMRHKDWNQMKEDIIYYSPSKHRNDEDEEYDE